MTDIEVLKLSLHAVVEVLKLGLHTVLCLALMWSCFCRATRTDATTIEAVRMSFWALFLASLVLCIAPWGSTLWPAVWDPYTVQTPVLALMAAVTNMQYELARYWGESVPQQFTHAAARPRGRRSGDRPDTPIPSKGTP